MLRPYMLFTYSEIIDVVLMTIVVGWIFKDVFDQRGVFGGGPRHTPEEYMRHAKNKTLGLEAWGFAALLVAPAIILHELGHKFVALAFGLTATFHAAWLWIGLGVIMKLIGGFIFFVPAYVSIAGVAPAWAFAATAVAGPLVNFLLWGVAKVAPDIRKNLTGKRLKQKEIMYWALFAKINLFLGIFNMIPIPGFDGSKVFLYAFEVVKTFI